MILAGTVELAIAAENQSFLGKERAKILQEKLKDNLRAQYLITKVLNGGLKLFPEQVEFMAYCEFTTNSRAVELYQKEILGTATREEITELAGFKGIKEFPYHKKAAALRTKQILQTASREEEAELAGIIEFDIDPANSRPLGVILVQKEYLKTITPSEAQELKRLRALVQASEEFLIKRGIELVVKEILGTSTRAEAIELKGLREFTTGFKVDYAGVALVKKSILNRRRFSKRNKRELMARRMAQEHIHTVLEGEA